MLPEILITLVLLTSGYVHFDTSTQIQWRPVHWGQPATTKIEYLPAMEVVCNERWGDKCKTFTILTGGVSAPDFLTGKSATHELAHVLDGMDDGLFNGSPGHPYIQTIAKEYYGESITRNKVCLSNIAEWYACEVERTGEIR